MKPILINNFLTIRLYLQDKLELDEYTKILQEDLVKAKENYVKKEGWSDENNWGEN